MPDQKHIVMKLADYNDQPYIRADAVKMVRFGDTFAMVFYQFDYVSVATEQVERDSTGNLIAKPIPVAKIALDRNAYEKFKEELDSLEKAIEKQNAQAQLGGEAHGTQNP